LAEDKKELKIDIKNTQIAEAIQLDKLKEKLAKKKAVGKEKKEKKPATKPSAAKGKKAEEEGEKSLVEKEEVPRRKARSISAFAAKEEEEKVKLEAKKEEEKEVEAKEEVAVEGKEREEVEEPAAAEKKELLGPTGKHINDLLPTKPEKTEEKPKKEKDEKPKKPKAKEPPKGIKPKEPTEDEARGKKGKPSKFKEFRDVKPTRQQASRFDGRDRHGLRNHDEDQRWRKKRPSKQQRQLEDITIRPATLSIRLPITIKDLASEMKLKASQLISKLFLQGVVVTINDLLEDETTIQLLGEEFGCAITIDTTEEERIRITDKTIKEEISESDTNELQTRAPVVTFMGHVDHGKTSLIDYIRKSSIASGEAGAITQHIGAFRCQTDVGDIAILDTPGHEAFSAMRARGADVTDIVVLVIAGDEGIRAQTEEAINHAKAAGVTIVVAINKSDRPNFDPETVYRQLADHELLPEKWGGQIITVNTSAVTGEGIPELLEMLALQSEVLELKASLKARARGSVLESELHKGLGAVATVLVQNGTLRIGDCLVFEGDWGRVKTMHDENGSNLVEAGPSTPVEVTGLSGLPDAGQEFIVVSSEQDAREISEKRMLGKKQVAQQAKKVSVESLFQQAADTKKKVLKIVLVAKVFGDVDSGNGDEVWDIAILHITTDHF